MFDHFMVSFVVKRSSVFAQALSYQLIHRNSIFCLTLQDAGDWNMDGDVATTKQPCPQCHRGYLMLCQETADQALCLCDNPNCDYPLGLVCGHNGHDDVNAPRLVVQRTLQQMEQSVSWQSSPSGVLGLVSETNVSSGESSRPLSSTHSNTNDDKVVYYPQWRNIEQLCWLHASLQLLLHSPLCHRLAQQTEETDAPLPQLHTHYWKCTKKALPGGDLSPTEASTLTHLQERAFAWVQDGLHVRRGCEDGVLFALPLLVKSLPALAQQMCACFTYVVACTSCGGRFRQEERRGLVVSLPRPDQEWALRSSKLWFKGSCFGCGAPDQLVKILWQE